MENQPEKRLRITKGDRVAVLVAAVMLFVLIVACSVFAVLQTEANKKTAAEVEAFLIGKTFTRDDKEYTDFSILYMQHCDVSFFEDGTASISYSFDSENRAEDEANLTHYKIIEEHNESDSTENWTVHVSLTGKTSVSIGDRVFRAHEDEFGRIDYLTEDGYKIYFQSAHEQ